jgi:uncharacterized protein (DUF58 family)
VPTVVENRFLDPAVLAGISSLDLIAKTVVEGFLAGLHRSPDFGFSQEFAEYRAYTPGDDLRQVDWNVFARTERPFIKRYRGETNTALMVLLDASASMSFSSGPASKFDYARYLASALVYLAHLQRDSVGLIVFHDEVANVLQPSSRQGQLHRVLHGIEHARPGRRTDYKRPFFDLQTILKRRGIVALISDFFQTPDEIIKTVEPLRFRGNEVILFHLLDPAERQPDLRGPVLLEDMETGAAIETSAEFGRLEYPQKVASHIEALRAKSQSAGLEYVFLDTSQPLDAALRQYFSIREGRL